MGRQAVDAQAALVQLLPDGAGCRAAHLEGQPGTLQLRGTKVKTSVSKKLPPEEGMNHRKPQGRPRH